MLHIILSSVACPAVHFCTRDMIFGGKNLLNITCMFWFSIQLLSKALLILSRIQRDIHVHKSSCEVPIFLSDFNKPWILSTDFQKVFKFLENLPSRSQLFPGGRTDMQTWTKLIVPFRNFANAPKKGCIIWGLHSFIDEVYLFWDIKPCLFVNCYCRKYYRTITFWTSLKKDAEISS
jgi:hypothetical protein